LVHPKLAHMWRTLPKAKLYGMLMDRAKSANTGGHRVYKGLAATDAVRNELPSPSPDRR